MIYGVPRLSRVHRLCAAFCAISRRVLAGSFFARAFPPFKPPLRRASV